MEKEITEDVTVKVKETNNRQKHVIDMPFSVNTAQSGKAEYVTRTINGSIKALIIDADANVQIQVSLENHENIILFEDVNFFGTQYLPISTEKILKRNEKLQYSSTDWVLNDKLRVIVKGGLNTSVKFKIRYV